MFLTNEPYLPSHMYLFGCAHVYVEANNSCLSHRTCSSLIWLCKPDDKPLEFCLGLRRAGVTAWTVMLGYLHGCKLKSSHSSKVHLA